jgi:hypothetical protein
VTQVYRGYSSDLEFKHSSILLLIPERIGKENLKKKRLFWENL